MWLYETCPAPLTNKPIECFIQAEHWYSCSDDYTDFHVKKYPVKSGS